MEVKIKQEDSLRAELVTITEQSAAVRGKIILKKARLKRKLAELREMADRVFVQQMFLKYVHVYKEQMEELKKKLEELERIRNEKLQEMLKFRQERKGLEKLKEKAKQEYLKEQQRIEQIENDDVSTVRFARKIQQS